MKSLKLSLSFAFMIMLVGIVLADGMVVPVHERRPRPVTPQLITDAFTVEYHVVTCDIAGQHAETGVDQKIKNVSGGLAQAQYMFPIPRGASISNFSMYIGEKETQGEMLEAGQARKIYEDYVRRTIDPALLEYVGTGVYKTSVFPFQKDEAKRIRLKYKELLTQEQGLVRYLYPLNTEKFSKFPLKRVRVEVNIQTDKPIVTLYSPTHPIQINRIDSNRVQVVYEATEVKPHEDFEIFYAVEEGKFAANVLSYKAEGEETGYFCTMIAPNTDVDAPQMAKDIVLVADISGSMQDDRKIFQAKEALTHIVKNLNAKDRFNVIAFSDFINVFKDGMVENNEANIKDAQAFIQRLRAEGGTDIEGSLEAALKCFSGEMGERQRVVIFMTDGKPTVGEREPAKISKKVNALNADKKAKIFVFAIGEDLNAQLVDWISTQNHGFTEYIRSGESISERVTSFYNKIKNPVLTDVTLTCEGVRIEHMLPRELPDVFSGTQLTVVGRFVGKGEATLTLKGKLVGKDYERKFKADFVEKSVASDSAKVWIEHLWASRRIGSLINQIRLHGESGEVKEEVIKLSKKYGIPTPYTSFLVREDVDPTNGRRVREQAMRHMEDKKDEGEDAVRDAAKAKELGNAEKPGFNGSTGLGGNVGGGSGSVERSRMPAASGTPQRRIITVGTKTFYLVNKQWVDSTINEDDKEETKIKMFSDEFFELLGKLPELNKYVARGAVKIKIGDKIYNLHN